MPGFTTRNLQAAPTPEPKRIAGAAEQIDIAKQALIKAAHLLDDSPTRHFHKDVLLAKEPVDRLSVRLTEFAGD